MHMYVCVCVYRMIEKVAPGMASFQGSVRTWNAQGVPCFGTECKGMGHLDKGSQPWSLAGKAIKTETLFSKACCKHNIGLLRQLSLSYTLPLISAKVQDDPAQSSAKRIASSERNQVAHRQQ
jgi:hypothetical protein